MSSREFTDWQAFYQIDPFGAQRDNWHAAMLAMVVARALGSKDVALSDFMLREVELPQRKSPSEIFAAIKGWALSLGAIPKQ